MPPQEIPLDDYKVFIYDVYCVQKKTFNFLHHALQERAAAHVGRRTLERRLSKWGFVKQKKQKNTPELVEALHKTFYNEVTRGDKALFEELAYQGHQVSRHGVSQLRYEAVGPLRYPSELREAADILAGALMRADIEGVASNYGREMRMAHFRRTGRNIAQYVLDYPGFFCAFISLEFVSAWTLADRRVPPLATGNDWTE